MRKAVLGIDIGATKVKLAPVFRDGTLGRSVSFPVPDGIKAKQLASSGSVKLGAPTYISESSGYIPVPRYYEAAPAPAALPTTPISPGETEIQLTVQVVYSIK